MAAISQFGTIVSTEMITPEIEEDLTHRWKDYKGRDYFNCLVLYGKKYCIIPRFYIFHTSIPVKMKISAGKEIKADIRGELREIQQKIVEDVIKNEFATPEKGNAGVLLKLGTGFGKTFIAMGLIGKIKQRTLIVTHRVSLAMQWCKCISEFLSCSATQNVNEVDKDIYVLVVNTLEKVAPEFYEQFGFVIFDEVHKYCTSSKYSKVLMKCQRMYMLGLSATPEKSDGSEIMAFYCVGPVRSCKEKAATNFDVEIRQINFAADKKYTQTLYRDNYGVREVDYSSTLKNILSNDDRAEKILEELEKVDDGRFIYVFSDRREYLNNLRELYISKNKHKSQDLCFMLGGMKEAEILKTKKEARIIFATYQCACEGESIERMNTIILATPCKKQIEQTLGRILRSDEDGKKRIVIDFVDKNTILYKQWTVRRDFYNSRNYTIREITQ